MTKVSTKVSTSLQLLSEQAPSRCKVPGIYMFDSSCKANEFQISKIKNIEADAQVLYRETVDRYKLYVQSIQLENSNCARAGFSSKLWQTEEQYVQPSLLRFSSFFIQQVDEFLSKPWAACLPTAGLWLFSGLWQAHCWVGPRTTSPRTKLNTPPQSICTTRGWITPLHCKTNFTTNRFGWTVPPTA